MGWNEVHQSLAHPLWTAIPSGARFYFVHSYYPVPVERDLVAGYSRYPFPFACAVAQGNLFAVQFHPEKSQAAGLQLLRNFVEWDGRYQPRRSEQALPELA
jgi:glutamine amidotransferase